MNKGFLIYKLADRVKGASRIDSSLFPKYGVKRGLRDKGQIVIPKDARQVYGIKPGDALIMLGDERGIALLKTEIFQNAIDQAMGGLTK